MKWLMIRLDMIIKKKSDIWNYFEYYFCKFNVICIYIFLECKWDKRENMGDNEVNF